MKTVTILTRGERGQTMLEFCVAALVALGLLGALFDLGIAYRNYSLLSEVTGSSVREVASTLGAKQGLFSCKDVTSYASKTATTALHERLGVSGNYAFTGQAYSLAGSNLRIELKGEWPLSCFFCNLMPAELKLRASSTAMVENSNFKCS